jgi:cation diffusion facilitator CzcD-associated flavoprotein CzcO
VEVAIVGSGFAGICMAVKLKQAGIQDFVILEKDDDLGGTWRDNTYPGCACDIPSYLYSFSFAPNPHWSRLFAPWDEILQYLRDCADRFGVTSHIRYGAEVTAAAYDDEHATWKVVVNGNEKLTARALVAGVGTLHDPHVPDLPGLQTFAGTAFHSARWNHEHDLTGRRVGVVGTGASAIQFVPRIAEQADRSTVFQRTAPWVAPKPDREIGARERALHARFPAGQRAIRGVVYAGLELRGLGFALSPKLMKALELQSRRHLRKQVTDPGLRAKLTPDYQIGCKRILISSDYYPALARDNVELVTDRVTRVIPQGVVTADGTEHPCDTLVLGTGFNPSANLTRMRITGRDGLDLNELWQRDGKGAHLGITVAGFPNLFLLYGPNTTLGHSSMIYMFEAQTRYVLQAISLLRNGTAYVEVRAEVQRRFIEAVRNKLDSTVWQSGCASWYLDEKGRNTTIWPRFTFDYWWRTRRFDPRDYLTGQGRA